MAKTYKSKSAPSLFEKEETIRWLKDDNDAFFLLKEIVDFEMFRPILEAEILNKNKDKRGAKLMI